MKNKDSELIRSIHDKLNETYGIDKSENIMVRLMELADRQGWQPISTAPKDQWILGYCDKVTVQTRYFPNIDSWEIPWHLQIEYGGKWQPTHWMPLPDPPQIP